MFFFIIHVIKNLIENHLSPPPIINKRNLSQQLSPSDYCWSALRPWSSASLHKLSRSSQGPCLTSPKCESHHFLSQETSCFKAVILGPQLHVRPKFVIFNTFRCIYGWMEQLTEVWHEKQRVDEKERKQRCGFFLVCVFARGRLVF